MKALLLKEYRKLELTDMPVPDIGPEDVLVRVAACGICGSDIHGYDGSSGRRIPPLVMGHEAAGTVESVGENVTHVQVGDRVTFDSMVSCGKCSFCEREEFNLCDNRMVLGVSCGDYRRHGAFAEFVQVPERIVFKLPERLPFEHAALVEPVSVAYHAVMRSQIETGMSALVVGSGMIGLLVIQVLKHFGCSPIIAADQDDDRLAAARKCGADEVFNVTKVDLPATVRQLTEGHGADVALEVVGITPTVEAAVESVRKGGTVTLVGNLSPKVELPLQSVVTREISLIGTCGCCGEYPECLELLASGAVDVSPIISATAPLEEGPQWFSRLYDHEPGLMKVILKP